MKTQTLLLTFLLAATALAFAPSAQAAEIPGPVVCVTDPCPPYPLPIPNACTLKQATPDRLPLLLIPANPRQTVWGNDAGCDIDVGEDMWACAPPSGFVVERTVGPVHVEILVCDGGVDVPPIVSASAAPPIQCVMAPCGPGPIPVPSACALKAATPAEVRQTAWGNDAGCDVDVVSHPNCAPPSATRIERTIAFVHVDTSVCDGGLPGRIIGLIGPLIST